MPTVPTVTGRQVESRGFQSPGFQAFDQPNIGDAVIGAGQQALNVFGEAKQQADLALTQDATQRLYAVGSGLMDDPKEGLMTLQGKNAIGQAPDTSRNLIMRCKVLPARYLNPQEMYF